MSGNINIEQTIEEVDINESSTVEAVDVTINQTIEDVNITVNESDSTIDVSIEETIEPVSISVEETAEYVTVNVEETVETVNIQVAEAPYIPLKWLDYVVYYPVVSETVLDNGEVLERHANNTTIYQFIPEPYVYSEDAIYTDFDGTTLSNLLARRI